ncbi:aldolase II superfamily protein [compost metagenome]
MEHAFRELDGLERACNIQVAAQAGGNDQLLHASKAAIAKVHEQSKRFSDGQGEGIQRHWDALIRQLDREGLDYQD